MAAPVWTGVDSYDRLWAILHGSLLDGCGKNSSCDTRVATTNEWGVSSFRRTGRLLSQRALLYTDFIIPEGSGKLCLRPTDRIANFPAVITIGRSRRS
jgi:hypothetical protein